MGRQERPLQPGPLYDFASDLRKLRQDTGLTYRVLARKAGYSPSALSAAASGDNLPTLDVLLAYVGVCGGDTAHWKRRWQEVSAARTGINPGPGDAGPTAEGPACDEGPAGGEGSGRDGEASQEGSSLASPGRRRRRRPARPARSAHPRRVRTWPAMSRVPGRRLKLAGIVTTVAAVAVVAVALLNSGRSDPQAGVQAGPTSRVSQAAPGHGGHATPKGGPLAYANVSSPPVTGPPKQRSAVPGQTVHAWSHSTGGRIASSPAVADGTVYTASDDHYLYAISAGTGQVLKRVGAGTENDSSPVVADGRVYVGSWNDDSVYAFNASLVRQWTFRTGSAVDSTPTVAGGTVYVGSDDHNMYAIDAATGLQIWKKNLSGEINAKPVVADGKVLVGTKGSDPTADTMYALNAATGDVEWSLQSGPIDSSAAVAGATVYFGSNDDLVRAVELQDGHARWTFNAGGAVESTPAVANGVVYVGSDDGSLYALSAASGKLLWKYGTGAYVQGHPAVAGSSVYFGSYNNNVYALNAATGGLLWQHATGGHVESGPAVAGGVVYVGSDDGTLYALNAATGKV
jgi:outer membrane protein assembly factor BamB